MEQCQFGFLSISSEIGQPFVNQQQKKKYFIPPSLENALSEGDVKDHSMLWLRSLAKSSKKRDSSFLFHQVNEIKYKKNEYDQAAIVRCAVLKELVDSVIEQKYLNKNL